MIVRFPFTADSNSISFPFLADKRHNIIFDFHGENLLHYEYPDLEEDIMVLKAEDQLLLFVEIFALLDSIAMKINAQGDLEIHMQIWPDLVETAMHILAHELELSLQIKIIEDGNGNIDMVIKADDDVLPEIFIDAARTAFFRAWLRLQAHDAETRLDIGIPLNPSNVYIRAHDGLSIGPITTTLDDLNACMAQLVEMWKPLTIGDLDDTLISLLDPKHIPDYGRGSLSPHLEIAAVKDEEQRIQLVLRAADDTGATVSEAVTLGYLDDLRIGDVDPIQNPGYKPISLT